MRPKPTMRVAGAVAIALSGSCHAETNDELLAELNRLRERVESLQEQVRSRQATPAPAPASVSAPAPANVSAARYKGVTLTLGGFVAAETIYRQHNQGNDISTNWSATPYENNAVGHTREMRLTARQSRLSLLAEGSRDLSTRLSFYSELDFQGGAQTANSNESNSYNPRLRHLYGTIDWQSLGLHVLGGQTWSLVTLNGAGITPRNEVAPPTIEGQYLPGFSWARQPQVRITKDFGGTLWLALSVENPQTTFYASASPFLPSTHVSYQIPGGVGFDAANTLSINARPDVVGKMAYERPFAGRTMHVEAFGLLRSFYERLDRRNSNVSGGGVGAGLWFSLIPHLIEFESSALAGRGIGRYGSGQLPDATFDPLGHIEPIREVQILAGLTVHPTSTLDLYVFGGREKASARYYSLLAGSTPQQYGYGNPSYSNVGCVEEASTSTCTGNTRLLEQVTVGFWHKPYSGGYGQVRYGLQYSHTERKSFPGVGGEPTGIQNVVLASLRYYPF